MIVISKSAANFVQSALSILFCASACVLISSAHAETGCPKIGGLIDFNCDQQLKIVFTGDSIVAGTADAKRALPGYPGRIQKALPNAEVVNLGIPGVSSSGLLSTFKQALSKSPNGKTATALRNADLIVVTVGVNDFFSNTDPSHTLRNIVSIVKYLKDTLKRDDGSSPLVAVGSLIFCLRPFEQPFIRKLDDLMIKYNSTATLPVLFRFDTVDVRTHPRLSSDRLHPNSSGYDAMAALALKVIKTKVQTLMASQRTDVDADGIYDQLEPVFGTDPSKADTDGDGVSDGDEVFITHTNPQAAD